MISKESYRVAIGKSVRPEFSRRRLRVFSSLLLFVLLFAFFTGCGKEFPPTRNDGEVAVHFIDVGQGDAILIEDGAKTVLIDTGSAESTHTDALLSYLRKRNIRRLDYLILTHPDEDHIGGAVRLLENITVSVCLLPDVVSNTTVFRDTLDALDDAGVFSDEAKAKDVYPLENASLTVLSPKGRTDSQNEGSAVVRLTVGTRHFLFTGDAGEETERILLAEYSAARLRADVLKISHHGASGAECDEFLDAVSPTYGVISCGKDNAYGHPTKEVIYRCEEHGMRLFRTDESGSIVFLTDGRTLTVKTER